mgnify:FL=1
MLKNYPRVLLLGHSFNNYTGMGITLTNLFAEWPKENIAVWADDVDPVLCDIIRPCVIYIGQKDPKRGSIKCEHISLKNKCRLFLSRQYHKFGFHELKADSFISEQKIQDARNFDPEIVFCALGSDVAMKRCEKIMDGLPHAKLVLYIVDDWVNTKINTRYFSSFWRKKYDKDFRHILERAGGLLSICQYMTDEYKKQYGKLFFPFHNPVNLEEWKSIETMPKYPDGTISIVYVGKINTDTAPCLLDMMEVVQELNKQSDIFLFDIYSPDYYKSSYLFNNKHGVHVFPPVKHEDIPNLIKSYSALFLPLGFSKQSRAYVRLSMPTKLTEYLASGKPTIVYCPKEIALSKYLSDKDCALICTDNNMTCLKEVVANLQDKNTYNHLVDNSLSLAAQHDVNAVRECFRKRLCSFL